MAKKYLFNYGDTCNEITGGWGMKQMWSNYPGGTGGVVDDYLYSADESQSSFGNGEMVTKQTIDMRGYSKLYAIISCTVTTTNGYGTSCGVAVTKEDFNHNVAWGTNNGYHYTDLAFVEWTSTSSTSVENHLIEIDISNIDEGTVWFRTWSGALSTHTAKGKCYAIWMEGDTDIRKFQPGIVGKTNVVEGSYINGPAIFIEDEFKGTTLNTDLWTWRADYTATCTVNNGITISNGSDASYAKMSYLQLNRLFTGKEKRITVNATVTNLAGNYKESFISMFTGYNSSEWGGVQAEMCGVTLSFSNYSGNKMRTWIAPLVSSGSVTKTETLANHSLSLPEVWRFEVDLENGKVTTYAGSDKVYEGAAPANMELAIGKPFLFITSQMWYANSISLANVSVMIE